MARKAAGRTIAPEHDGPSAVERGFPPLRRETLLNQIYEQLCAGLAAGMFLPGESVTLRQVADMFGTSIMPVREAVGRLIAERALAMLPNRKVVVPEMSRERFMDLVEFRRIVEVAAARRAAPNLTGTREIAVLAEINSALLEGIADGDVGRALRANRDFHFAIYAAARSEALMHAIRNVWLQVGPFLYLSMASKDMPWTTAHHLSVLKSLSAGDGEAVAAAILDDIDEPAAHLLARQFHGIA